jgi:hypothetical protein
MASSCNRKTNPSAQPPKPEAPSKTEFQIETPTGEAETLPRFFLGPDSAPTLRSLHGWETIFFGTIMRLACGLAIALWLSFPAAGMASRQQETAGSANAAGQAPAPPGAPAETAPAEKSRTENAPAEQVPAETTPAAPANPQTPAAGKTAPENVAKEKTDTDSARRVRKRRKRSSSAPNGAPHKIVVREGGASEPAAQIAPGMTSTEATRQRDNAEQLLGATDDKLKRLAGRTLDAKQQETVGQIRNYMEGARSALKEGDVRRANTLAQKAHLLSDDLVKH